MRIKLSKFTFAMIGAAVAIPLVWAFVLSEVRLAERRKFVTREIYAKAGLVMGDLDSVSFAAEASPDVVAEMLRLLVDAKAPKNWLMLVKCDLQPQAWEEIGRMYWLRHLSLQHTNITDADLLHISRLHQLYSLSLTGTRVTDTGIKKLTKLTKLRELSVNATQVSEAELLKLKETLPLLDVEQTISGLRESRKEQGTHGKPKNGEHKRDNNRFGTRDPA